MDTTTPPPGPTPTKLDGTEKKNGHDRGRPPKFDPVLASKLVEHVREGHFLETAANLVGLPVQTVRAWLRTGANSPRSKFANFSSEVRKARAEAEHTILGDMKARAAGDASGGWKERAWRLERLDPRKYGPRVIVEFRSLVGDFLDHLEASLDADTFEKVLDAASSFDGEETSSTVDEV